MVGRAGSVLAERVRSVQDTAGVAQHGTMLGAVAGESGSIGASVLVKPLGSRRCLSIAVLYDFLILITVHLIGHFYARSPGFPGKLLRI